MGGVVGCGVEACGTMDDVDDGGDDDSGDGDMDIHIPNPNNMGCSNHNTSHICTICSNSRMDRSSHNTNYTKAMLLRPTSRTSRLHTLALPIPYRPKS